MKRLLSLCLTALIATACNMITYEGDFNTDGFYKQDNMAYLYFAKNTDTLQSATFAFVPVEQESVTFKVPIKIVGVPADKDLRIGIAVDTKASTAELGKHYLELPKYAVIPADSLVGYFEATMIKKELRTDTIAPVRLVLKLVDSDEIKVAFSEGNRVVLQVDNFYDDTAISESWNLYWSSFMGVYNRMVYMKFLEQYNYDETALMNDFFQTGFFVKWAAVRKYFDEHPELGITIETPDWMNPPYVD